MNSFDRSVAVRLDRSAPALAAGEWQDAWIYVPARSWGRPLEVETVAAARQVSPEP